MEIKIEWKQVENKVEVKGVQLFQNCLTYVSWLTCQNKLTYALHYQFDLYLDWSLLFYISLK